MILTYYVLYGIIVSKIFNKKHLLPIAKWKEMEYNIIGALHFLIIKYIW